MTPSELDILKASCLVDEWSDCWIWQGGTANGRYGKVYRGGKTVAAHRLAYSLAKGPIPSGYEIHHTCNKRLCLNPDHLQALSAETHREIPKDNRRSEAVLAGIAYAREVRASKPKRLFCRRGHEYTPENVRIYQGRRYCKACHAENTLRYYHERRAAQGSTEPACQ